MPIKAKNNRFINALLRKPVDCTPVWVMRQAGRYLPEYRKVRAEAGDFMTLCQTPELACEVTLQPLRRFDLDAAILFSDILTIPDAMGLGLSFAPGEGPVFDKPIHTLSDIKKLPQVEVEAALGYVFQAVELIQHELAGQCPLIGFSGSPWTLACYMVEGRSSRDFKKVKALMYQHPDAMHQLLERLSETIVNYLRGQIQAGVNAIMLFDTWGGVLSEACYHEFSLSYMRQILNALAEELSIPSIVFTKQGGLWLEAIADSGCSAIGLDWTIDIAKARARVGSKVALQGNMDPNLLLTNPQRIEQEVKRILEAFGNHPGHIFNLGHGITPDVPPEHMAVFVDAVHCYSRHETQV